MISERYKKLEELLHATYLIEDKGIIKFLCAVVVANRLPLKPFWAYLVATSGGGKTEFINTLNKVIGIYPISSLTSRTFISGMRRADEETSLLHKIKSGMITFKDFTSVLSMHLEEKAEVYAQLREIFDGAYVKEFGNGKSVKWKGKLGFLAGVTTSIYLARDLYAAMGERFVMYSIDLPNEEKLAHAAMEQTEIVEINKLAIQEALADYLDNEIGVPVELPKLQSELSEEIEQLGVFVARARSPVERDWYSREKEIIFKHSPEAPTRLPVQLGILARALMVMNGHNEVTDLDRHIIYKVALDSITSTRRKTLQELARYSFVHTFGLATKINYPTGTVRRWLEDLNALEMVDRIKGSNKDKWKLREKYQKVIEKYENIKPVDQELDERTAEQEVGDVTQMIQTEEETIEETNFALSTE